MYMAPRRQTARHIERNFAKANLCCRTGQRWRPNVPLWFPVDIHEESPAEPMGKEAQERMSLLYGQSCRQGAGRKQRQCAEVDNVTHRHWEKCQFNEHEETELYAQYQRQSASPGHTVTNTACLL
jgi:hypothetical protein